MLRLNSGFKLERSGGQAQFIEYQPPEASDSRGLLLVWMEHNLEHRLSLTIIARHARISTRTLSRLFREQVGLSPAQCAQKQGFVERNIYWNDSASY